ncbi:centromere protein W-like [Acomys russatus]|uniref:centromere protein W-like n=1 Tax=Acomys russatus TaxID=60746 RepID=UPI0021E24325|nr:centromere protein W-like [Acomys russatus]
MELETTFCYLPLWTISPRSPKDANQPKGDHIGVLAFSKLVNCKAPRGFLKCTFKQKKPHLRLETCSDLLIHLNCLLFVHRLAEESRTNACGSKSGVITQDHVLTAGKVILRKSRG